MGMSVGGVTRLNDDNKSMIDGGVKTKGKKFDPFTAIQFDESDRATPTNQIKNTPAPPRGLTEKQKKADDILENGVKTLP